MATLTIRNLPEDVKRSLRVRAAEDGRSLEEAVRLILIDQVGEADQAASRIGADEILRRAANLASDPPADRRYEYFSQKEISDYICGEFDEL